MRTIFHLIWSLVGALALIWFGVVYMQNCSHQPMHDGVIIPTGATHEKQSIEQFLDDHPDIKKRVDELNRQYEADARYKRS